MELLKQVASSAGLPSDPLSDEARDWFLEQHELTDVDTSYFDEALRHGIPHNVLNAKYHEKEALIISEAGRKGAVTISTNMAGRGVDILLGGRVIDETVSKEREAELEDGGLAKDYADTFMSFRRGGQERAAPPLPISDQERQEKAEEVRALGGMYILGTERHESRRIDNQLRGRSGRQGDPGMSRFYVSLEDQLWKIFNAKMLENPVLKAWPTQEEVRAKFISGMIQKTQERIENHFFEARKHVLEYDDVLNSQRETIYAMRREILLGKDCGEEVRAAVEGFVMEIVDKYWSFDDAGEPLYDYEGLYAELNALFPLIDYCSVSEMEAVPAGPELQKFCAGKALAAYDEKAERLGSEIMPQLERQVMLRSVNDQWMDHLQMIDYIREGIGLRGYGQVDPLVAYKRETFDLFQNTQKMIRDQAVGMIFTAEVRVDEPQQQRPQPQMKRVDESELNEDGMVAPSLAESAPAPEDFDVDSVDWSRLGRNETCLCGSGKKFKNCHYGELRATGKI
jgi:preprotein translocase subunit SecA